MWLGSLYRRGIQQALLQADHSLARIFGSVRQCSTANHAQVIVAGAGPTGLVLGLHLARYGIKSVIVERSQAPTNHPQAHFINNRTMEVFRHLDGLADEVAALSPPLEEWRRFVYCRSMAGEQLGQVDHFEGQAGPGNPAVSPEPLAHLPQHRLLPLLLKRAHKQQHLIKIMTGSSVVACEQSSDGVVVGVQDSGGKQVHLHGSFLAAADGAHSTVRRFLEIPMDGDPGIQHLINIHFVSRTMGRLAAAHPGMLYFIFNAQVVAVLVAHSIQGGEFVAQVPYFPPLQSIQDFDSENCLALVRACAGLPDLQDIHIKQIKPWTMSAEIARRFSSGRVFLLGDAAHRFPPAGGFGMNTGVQDAHNLAWKLAAVLQGWADPQLLDSFEVERKPVAAANTALSVDNWKEAIRLPQALGLDPDAANLVSRLVSSAPLPRVLGKQVLEGSLGLGRFLAAAPLGPLEPWRKARLSKILSSGETLRLQFAREDLGFIYEKGAVLPEHDGQKAPLAHEVKDRTQNPSTRGAPYEPSSAPGCRLPHYWLYDKGSSLLRQELPTTRSSAPPMDSAASQPALHDTAATWDARLASSQKAEGKARQRQRVSTLDLVAAAGPGLLLLVDCTKRPPAPSCPAGPGSSDKPPKSSEQRRLKQATGHETEDEGGEGRVQLAIGEVFGLELAQAALRVSTQLRVPLQVAAILSSKWPEGSRADHFSGFSSDARAVAGLSPSGLQASVLEAAVVESPLTPNAPEKPAARVYADGSGRAASALPEVLLVRPDGHVAWRWVAVAACPAHEMLETFGQQLLTAIDKIVGQAISQQ